MADVKLVLLDWLSLNMVFQVVIWPLRLYANWRIDQTLWVIAAVGAYSLLIGVAIAWGLIHTPSGAPRALKRTVAMIACLLLVFGEPLTLALVGAVDPTLTWTLRISPLQAVWELTTRPIDYAPQNWPAVIASVAAAALAGWAVLVMFFKSGPPGEKELPTAAHTHDAQN